MPGILLGALAGCKTEKELERIYELAKDTVVTSDAVAKAIRNAKEQGFYIGARVLFYDDRTDVGTVIGFNEARVGCYTGDRYPLVVKFRRGTFEFEPHCFTLIE